MFKLFNAITHHSSFGEAKPIVMAPVNSATVAVVSGPASLTINALERRTIIKSTTANRIFWTLIGGLVTFSVLQYRQRKCVSMACAQEKERERKY